MADAAMTEDVREKLRGRCVAQWHRTVFVPAQRSGGAYTAVPWYVQNQYGEEGRQLRWIWRIEGRTWRG